MTNIVAEDYAREFYTKIWGMDQYCQRGGDDFVAKKNGRSIKIDCPVFHFLKQKGFTLTYIVYLNLFHHLCGFRRPLFNPLISLIITIILDWKFYERSLVNNHPRSQDYLHNHHRIKQRKKNRKVWILGNLFTINFSRKPKIAT